VAVVVVVLVVVLVIVAHSKFSQHSYWLYVAMRQHSLQSVVQSACRHFLLCVWRSKHGVCGVACSYDNLMLGRYIVCYMSQYCAL
jgi:hypothetical protein